MRLFIGCPINPDLSGRLQHISEKISIADKTQPLRWVSPFNYHMTLVFLGDVKESMIDKLLAQLEIKLANQFALSTYLSEISLFPFVDKPKVLAGLLKLTPALQELHQQSLRAVKSCRLRVDHKHFKPHITLARVQQPIINKVKFQPIIIDDEVFIDEIILYKSELKPQGAIYTPLFSMDLSS